MLLLLQTLVLQKLIKMCFCNSECTPCAADYSSETLMVTKGNVDIALVYQWIKLKCLNYMSVVLID